MRFSPVAVCLVLVFGLTVNASAASPVFVALDTDGNGELSISELGAIELIVAKIDANKDGTLSGDELKTLMNGASEERQAALKKAIADVPEPDAAEKKIQEVLADLDKNHRKGNLNVPIQDGQLLRLLVEAFEVKRAVEIGMSNGYSTIWTVAGLRKSDGKMTTFEIDENRAAQARKNFADSGIADRITIVMGDAHENVTALKDGIDFVFIDADKEGYVDYLNKLLPKVRPGGLIVAHNTKMTGVDKYIEAIKKTDELESAFVHQGHRGVAISKKK
jgi:predicted O-methyltransferase YrrM